MNKNEGKVKRNERNTIPRNKRNAYENDIYIN